VPEPTPRASASGGTASAAGQSARPDRNPGRRPAVRRHGLGPRPQSFLREPPGSLREPRANVDSPRREHHAATIVAAADLSLTECLEVTAAARPEAFTNLVRHLDPMWVEEALLNTGTATLRRRRLPADRVVWLVLGMAALRDMPITEVARQLELALPGVDGSRVVAPSALAQARARLGPDPMEWLFLRTGSFRASTSASDPWRGLALYGADGTTLRTRVGRGQDRPARAPRDRSQQEPGGCRAGIMGVLLAYDLIRLEMARIADELGVDRPASASSRRYVTSSQNGSGLRQP
jgi:transposase IS4-like protein